MPLAEGLAQEKAGFAELLDTPQSRAGRHLFFAERECNKVPGVTRADRPRDIASVAVIGAGTMGRGIAIAFLQAGYPVTLLETTQGALEQGLEKVREHFQRAAKKGGSVPIGQRQSPPTPPGRSATATLQRPT